MKKKRFKKKPNGHGNGVPHGLDPNMKWHSEDEMLAKLGMHKNTLYKYRKTGQIGYSKKGGKFYYSDLDYQAVMMRDHRDAIAI